MLPGRTDSVAQRSIEMLIGRLITDERFRTDFLSAPEDTLNDLCALGLGLSQAEIAALLNTDMALWTRAASQIDPRAKEHAEIEAERKKVEEEALAALEEAVETEAAKQTDTIRRAADSAAEETLRSIAKRYPQQ